MFSAKAALLPVPDRDLGILFGRVDEQQRQGLLLDLECFADRLCSLSNRVNADVCQGAVYPLQAHTMEITRALCYTLMSGCRYRIIFITSCSMK